MYVKDLVAEIKAEVNGESTLLTKQASGQTVSSSLSPEQKMALADRIEKAGHVQEASQRIVEMRQSNQASPGPSEELELRKLAYQQAARELGFKDGVVSPFNLLFGDMTEAQSSLAKQAADATTTLIQCAIEAGLSVDEGVDRGE